MRAATHAGACLFAAVLAAAPHAGAAYRCATDPAVVAPCFELRGRLSWWNGTPTARLWRIGTPRMLGIHKDRLPPGLAILRSDFDTELWGTFSVCPYTPPAAGRMQLVCIESWRHLQIRQRR